MDDNYDFRLMTRELLERQGFHVVSVDSGGEAEASLLRRPVSAVITDLYMPGMSGFGLMRRIREAGFPQPPVVAVTGYDFLSGPESRPAARQLGARAVLRKPISTEALFRALVSAVTAEPEPAEDTARKSGPSPVPGNSDPKASQRET